MIKITHKGNFERTDRFFKKMSELEIVSILDKYGKQGVEALAKATPVATGKTAESWYYEIGNENGSYTITWSNSNVVNYVNIALILDSGHATRNGGYVVGRNYINPTIEPIFKEIAESAWREVKSA